MIHNDLNLGIEPLALESLCDARAIELANAAEILGGKSMKRQVVDAIEYLMNTGLVTQSAVRTFHQLFTLLRDPSSISPVVRRNLHRRGQMEQVERGLDRLKERLAQALIADGYLEHDDV